MKAPFLHPALFAITALLLCGCGKAPSPPKSAMEGGKAGETRVFGGIEMVWCPPGSFAMGSPAPRKFEVLDWKMEWGGEEGRIHLETRHRVTLTQGFWLAKTETTQQQWESVMGGNPSEFKGPDLPVETVSWDDVQKWLAEMNRRHPLPEGWGWDLPTEGQGEYACRAGTRGPYAGSGKLDAMGWYDGNSGGKTKPVAMKQANDWGLHDMHGNVWEWCRDWYWEYSTDSITDPVGIASGSHRVFRGGSWRAIAQECRSAVRIAGKPDIQSIDFIGFRPAIVPAPQPLNLKP